MNCLLCQKPIEGRRRTKKYCSNTCKQYAYLNRSFHQTPPVNKAWVENPVKAGIETTDLHIVEGSDIAAERILDLNGQNHEYSKTATKLKVPAEKIYEYIHPTILQKLDESNSSCLIAYNYFHWSSEQGGRVTEENRTSFYYMLSRIRCIIENLFQLSYKPKVYHRTAFVIRKALDEMLLSEHVKKLPSDFPFFVDLLKMEEQFRALVKHLEKNKEGVKFILGKTAIVRYILILSFIRPCTEKQPFQKLFPNLCETPPNPNKCKA